MKCRACGMESPELFKFCGHCGEPLPKGEPLPPAAGERRQLTVMFCDLVGSTHLSARLDPEELREVIQVYQETSARSIRRYGGHIAQYLGDGLLVYFGYPTAHEDDAQRAVRAGLGILKAMDEVNPTIRPRIQQKLEVRIGVHTGLVVVGEIGAGTKTERLALGETPNIAARLQGLTDPGTLLMSEATRRLVPRHFALDDLGFKQLKGVSRPIEVFRVVAERRRHGLHSVAPLVGRDRELESLMECWSAARGGRAQAVMLSADAGFGKSRLVVELRRRLEADPHSWFLCRCSPFQRNSALYPIIDMLERRLRLGRDDPPEVRLARLDDLLSGYGLDQGEPRALLAHLLGLPLPETEQPRLDPQAQRSQTLDAITDLLAAAAQRQPVAFVIEDLHWVDPSTQELIDRLLQRFTEGRILLLLAFRPEFVPPWKGGSDGPATTRIDLGKLGRTDAQRLIENMAGGKAVPCEILDYVVERTEGNPLFLEELFKMVLESDLVREREASYELTGRLSSQEIPSTLQDSLMARLDRLGPAKETAQLAAVLGREFPFDLLRSVSSRPEEALKLDLERLLAAELLFHSGEPGRPQLFFKHALIQDVAYLSLLRSRRRHYHERIARTLEDEFPEVAAGQPALLARHYTEANLREEALPLRQKAGEKAIERSANVEAQRHLQKALDLVAGLEEKAGSKAERLGFVRREIDLQTSLALTFLVTQGTRSPELLEAYSRARDLCRRIGPTPQLSPVLFGLWMVRLTQVRLDEAARLAEESLVLAEQLRDTTVTLHAHLALGNTYYLMGDFTSTLQHMERALALCTPEQETSYLSRYGHDPRIQALMFNLQSLWFLGYVDQATANQQRMMETAKEQSHPYSLALALQAAATHEYHLRDFAATQRHASHLIEVCREHGFLFFEGFGMMFEGWARAMKGDPQAGTRELREGFEAKILPSGGQILWPLYSLLCAEGHLQAGSCRQGLKVLEEGLGVARQGEATCYLSEMLRLEGDLLAATQPTDLDAVRDRYESSIEVAKRQKAATPELRATVRLVRLLRRQGRDDRGRELVSTVYQQFSEGHESWDLRQARALL